MRFVSRIALDRGPGAACRGRRPSRASPSALIMSLTLRQTMIRLLEREEFTAQDPICILFLTPREMEEDLPHLQQSLKIRLKISPASCRRCGNACRTREPFGFDLAPKEIM
ncbi:hypothetical protein DFAR_340055 [Desulfarculales bacterium]